MSTALFAAASISRGQVVVLLVAAGIVVGLLLVSAALCLRAKIYAQLLGEWLRIQRNLGPVEIKAVGALLSLKTAAGPSCHSANRNGVREILATVERLSRPQGQPPPVEPPSEEASPSQQDSIEQPGSTIAI